MECRDRYRLVPPLDSDGGLIADDLVDIHGTKFWDRLSAAAQVEINRAVARWRLLDLDGRRARRDAGVQPVGRERPGPGRQVVSGHPGRRRGTAQRGAAPLHGPAPGGTELSAGQQCPGDLRHPARHLGLVFEDDRIAARRRDLRGVAVPHAGRVVERCGYCGRYAGASCRTRRGTWALACCHCRRSWPRPARRSGARWRTSRSGR